MSWGRKQISKAESLDIPLLQCQAYKEMFLSEYKTFQGTNGTEHLKNKETSCHKREKESCLLLTSDMALSIAVMKVQKKRSKKVKEKKKLKQSLSVDETAKDSSAANPTFKDIQSSPLFERRNSNSWRRNSICEQSLIERHVIKEAIKLKLRGDALHQLFD